MYLVMFRPIKIMRTITNMPRIMLIDCKRTPTIMIENSIILKGFSPPIGRGLCSSFS